MYAIYRQQEEDHEINQVMSAKFGQLDSPTTEVKSSKTKVKKNKAKDKNHKKTKKNKS